MRIAIMLYDGFDELDAIGPYEVFRTAGIDTALVTLEPAERVTGSHGLVITPHGVLDRPVDLVLVPGGGWNNRAQAGAWGEAERGLLPAALAELATTGTTVASVCTGAMLLASAGVLAGRPATTHHSARDDLATAGAVLVDARVVDDGDILTAGGVTSGLDLALHVVERAAGPATAAAVAREMEYHRVGEVWRGDR
jgi:transcriptional regulator GlxA family with amidase domain